MHRLISSALLLFTYGMYRFFVAHIQVIVKLDHDSCSTVATECFFNISGTLLPRGLTTVWQWRISHPELAGRYVEPEWAIWTDFGKSFKMTYIKEDRVLNIWSVLCYLLKPRSDNFLCVYSFEIWSLLKWITCTILSDIPWVCSFYSKSYYKLALEQIPAVIC